MWDMQQQQQLLLLQQQHTLVHNGRGWVVGEKGAFLLGH
jgi:hypothetical protein